MLPLLQHGTALSYVSDMPQNKQEQSHYRNTRSSSHTIPTKYSCLCYHCYNSTALSCVSDAANKPREIALPHHSLQLTHHTYKVACLCYSLLQAYCTIMRLCYAADVSQRAITLPHHSLTATHHTYFVAMFMLPLLQRVLH